MGTHMSRDEFAAALRAEMDRLGLDQKAASQRTGETVNRISDFLNARRASSDDKQVAILTALQRAAPTVEQVLAEYERDMLTRFRQLSVDLLTMSGGTASRVPDLAGAEAATRAPALLESGPRARRRQAK